MAIAIFFGYGFPIFLSFAGCSFLQKGEAVFRCSNVRTATRALYQVRGFPLRMSAYFCFLLPVSLLLGLLAGLLVLGAGIDSIGGWQVDYEAVFVVFPFLNSLFVGLPVSILSEGLIPRVFGTRV